MYVIIFLFLFSSLLFFIMLDKLRTDTKNYNEQLNSITDMQLCPQTIQYLNKFKNSYNTTVMFIIFFTITMMCMLFLLSIIKLAFDITYLNSYQIILISLFISFWTAFCVYKSQNCLLFRICLNGCVQPYFKQIIKK